MHRGLKQLLILTFVLVSYSTTNLVFASNLASIEGSVLSTANNAPVAYALIELNETGMKWESYRARNTEALLGGKTVRATRTRRGTSCCSV